MAKIAEKFLSHFFCLFGFFPTLHHLSMATSSKRLPPQFVDRIEADTKNKSQKLGNLFEAVGGKVAGKRSEANVKKIILDQCTSSAHLTAALSEALAYADYCKRRDERDPFDPQDPFLEASDESDSDDN